MSPGRSWIKVEDTMPEHPKVEALSDAGFRLMLRAWCRTSMLRSNGKLSAMWWGQQKPKPRAELVAAGLIEEAEDGHIDVHDFSDWQSRPITDELRAKRQEAGRLGGKAKAHGASNLPAPTEANGQANGLTPAQATPQATTPAVVLANGKHDLPIEGEGEGEGEKKPLAPTASPPRAPDEIWDTLLEVCGVNSPDITAAMRGSLNRAVADLRAVQASPGEIKIRARRYRQSMPNAQLTPPALAKHWATLSGPVQRAQPNATFGGW